MLRRPKRPPPTTWPSVASSSTGSWGVILGVWYFMIFILSLGDLGFGLCIIIQWLGVCCRLGYDFAILPVVDPAAGC